METTHEQEEMEVLSEELENRLSEPILKGDKGIEAAQVWMAGFVIAIVGLLVYSNTFTTPLFSGDQQLFLSKQADTGMSWLPLATVTLTQSISNNPLLFHGVSWLIHLLNAIFVMLLCRQIMPKTEKFAMLAGLLFMLHPLNAEAVNCMVGRPEVLATFFSLASLVLFLRATDKEEAFQPAYLTGSLIFLVLGGITDPAALLLPVLALCADWVRKGSENWRHRGRYLCAYWMVGGVMLAATLALTGLPTAYHMGLRLDHVVRLGRWLILPTGLSILHVQPPIPLTETLILSAVALIVSLGLLARRSPAGLAILWFGLACVLQPAILQERYAYFGMAGVVLLLPYIISSIEKPGPRTLLGLLSAAIIIASIAGAYLYNQTWRDEITLWTNAMDRNPTSPVPPSEIAHVALKQVMTLPNPEVGRQMLPEAEKMVRNSLALDPNNAAALSVLGTVKRMQGKPQEAAAAFKESLRVDLNQWEAAQGLAELYIQLSSETSRKEDTALAIDYCGYLEKLATQLKRSLGAEFYMQHAMLYGANGAWEEAEKILRHAVGDDSKSPLAGQLKEIQNALVKTAEMETKANTMLAKNPADPQGRKILAEVLLHRKQPLHALYLLDPLTKNQELGPDTWQLIGQAKAEMGSEADFIAQYPAPLPVAIPPAVPENPWLLLARRCAQSGLWGAAQTYLEHLASEAMDAKESPAMLLADIAVQNRQFQRANAYLEQACIKELGNPQPWLRRCDIAVVMKDPEEARRCLNEAQKRNAVPAEIKARKERIR